MGADPVSLEPLSMAEWEGLSEREKRLQSIGDVVASWVRWVSRERDAEGLPTTPDTHIILGLEGAPPVWPSIGQLTYWLQVIRDQDWQP